MPAPRTAQATCEWRPPHGGRGAALLAAVAAPGMTAILPLHQEHVRGGAPAVMLGDRWAPTLSVTYLEPASGRMP
jgi:hypothetical protein